MLEFMKCYPKHLDYIQVQSIQLGDIALVRDARLSEEMCKELAYSAWQGPVCVGAAGVMPFWPGRAMAWAVLSAQAKPFMVSITRKVRAILDAVPYRRVETTVQANFVQGTRWAEILGFRAEGTNEAYLPDGTDAIMYARVRR